MVSKEPKTFTAIITSSADVINKIVMEDNSTDQTKLKYLFIETGLIT
jgi:hypothetical protein